MRKYEKKEERQLQTNFIILYYISVIREIILKLIIKYLNVTNNQFAFQSNHSTTMCIIIKNRYFISAGWAIFSMVWIQLVDWERDQLLILYFSIYLNAVSKDLNNSTIGFKIHNVIINYVCYTEDLVIISPLLNPSRSNVTNSSNKK